MALVPSWAPWLLDSAISSALSVNSQSGLAVGWHGPSQLLPLHPSTAVCAQPSCPPGPPHLCLYFSYSTLHEPFLRVSLFISFCLWVFALLLF